MKVCFQQLAGWSSGLTVKWGIKMGVQAVQKNSLQVKEFVKKKKERKTLATDCGSERTLLTQIPSEALP